MILTAAKLNCPNCGAPIIGNSCKYCGTDFNLAVFSDSDRNSGKNEQSRTIFYADDRVYVEYLWN